MYVCVCVCVHVCVHCPISCIIKFTKVCSAVNPTLLINIMHSTPLHNVIWPYMYHYHCVNQKEEEKEGEKWCGFMHGSFAVFVKDKPQMIY